ncbi:MAG: histidinol-phosphatase [Clostridia bacterium]|nr:histidinol-phosphatase [Clostridia bacterium]
MICGDFHTHTCFCDGKNTPEEMVSAAIAAGMTKLGFSGHSHTPFDESYCMSVTGTEEYKKEVRRLQEAYRGQLEIFLGVEQDYYGDAPSGDYDYVIGSVHYIHLGDEYIPVDEGNEKLKRAADAYFGGDILCVCEAYYQTVADIVNKTDCDIIGHFDLPTKYLEKEQIFDPSSPRYKKAWQAAADKLLQAKVPFEINTGAMARGCRSTPYPAPEILSYLASHGGTVVLSGDSHSAKTLRYAFDRCEKLVASTGLTYRYPKKFGITPEGSPSP